MAITGRQADVSGPIYFEEPPVARWLFGSSRAAWIWLIARLWLGWEWFQAGWTKVFGGNITLRFWDWGDPQYSLTGDGNVGWVKAEGDVGRGDAVAAFADRAIKSAEGPHPDVAFGWYVNFLEWIRDTAHVDPAHPGLAQRRLVRAGPVGAPQAGNSLAARHGADPPPDLMGNRRGLSPRKQALTIYVSEGLDGYGELLGRLGPHRTGKSCLYIKRLSDVKS